MEKMAVDRLTPRFLKELERLQKKYNYEVKERERGRGKKLLEILQKNFGENNGN